MSVTIQTVTTTLRDALGTPVNGSVSIRPLAPWTYNNGANQDRLIAAPVTVSVSAGKVTPFVLPPSLGGGVTLTDARYSVTYNLTGVPNYTEEWIIDDAVGATLEWAAIQIAASSLTAPQMTLLPGPQGPQGPAGSMTATVNATGDWNAYLSNAYLSGNTLLNSPPALPGVSPWFHVRVQKISTAAAWAVQYASDFNGVASWWRNYNANTLTWTPWRLLARAETAWTTLALTGGWQNFGGVNPNLAYMMSPSGNVTVRGMIKLGALASSAATLPSGFRPVARLRLPASTGAGFGEVIIEASGSVIPQSGSATWFFVFASYKGEL